MADGPHDKTAERETSSSAYWDSVSRAVTIPTWRRYSDKANAALVDRHLGSTPGVRSALKTDLFDEAWTGGFIEAIQRHVEAPVVGVDVSLRVAKAAKRQCSGVVAVVADLRALPFRDHAFELVVSPSTMDHFETTHEIQVALAELHRTLNPGGHLIATLDNPLNPIITVRNRAVRLWMRFGLIPYFVGTTLGPGRFKRAMVRAEFVGVRMGATQHFPRLMLVVLDKVGLSRGWIGQMWMKLATVVEKLESLPTRFLTGQFVVAVARRAAAVSEDPPAPKSPTVRKE